jgi:hypothetical protein
MSFRPTSSPADAAAEHGDASWLFSEPVHTLAYTSSRVLIEGHPVLLVADLPRGWRAYRSLADGLWFREPSDLPLPEPVRRRDPPRGWTHWLAHSSLPSPWLWK